VPSSEAGLPPVLELPSGAPLSGQPSEASSISFPDFMDSTGSGRESTQSQVASASGGATPFFMQPSEETATVGMGMGMGAGMPPAPAAAPQPSDTAGAGAPGAGAGGAGETHGAISLNDLLFTGSSPSETKAATVGPGGATGAPGGFRAPSAPSAAPRPSAAPTPLDLLSKSSGPISPQTGATHAPAATAKQAPPSVPAGAPVAGSEDLTGTSFGREFERLMFAGAPGGEATLGGGGTVPGAMPGAIPSQPAHPKEDQTALDLLMAGTPAGSAIPAPSGGAAEAATLMDDLLHPGSQLMGPAQEATMAATVVPLSHPATPPGMPSAAAMEATVGLPAAQPPKAAQPPAAPLHPAAPSLDATVPFPATPPPVSISAMDTIRLTPQQAQAQAQAAASAPSTSAPIPPPAAPPSAARGKAEDSLYLSQKKKGLDAFAASDWKQAVHYLSVAVSLRPDDQEISDKLQEARRQRRGSGGEA